MRSFGPITLLLIQPLRRNPFKWVRGRYNDPSKSQFLTYNRLNFNDELYREGVDNSDDLIEKNQKNGSRERICNKIKDRQKVQHESPTKKFSIR